eukprot:748196-Hanusia_phi.AAC.6
MGAGEAAERLAAGQVQAAGLGGRGDRQPSLPALVRPTVSRGGRSTGTLVCPRWRSRSVTPCGRNLAIKSLFELGRLAWERDEANRRRHGKMLELLDFLASKDTECHFQHPMDDPRSDAHQHGGDETASMTVETFGKLVVWPMDFSTMRGRLRKELESDHHLKHAEDYQRLEEIQVDWLLCLINVLSFHHDAHERVKQRLASSQRPLKLVPKAPTDMRVKPSSMGTTSCVIEWRQPEPNQQERVKTFFLFLLTSPDQLVESSRTGASPGEQRTISIEASEEGAGSSDSSLGATQAGGSVYVEGLAPQTVYEFSMQSVSEEGILSPLSGESVRFQTLPAPPEAPQDLHTHDVESFFVTLRWTAARDLGAAVSAYEVEYRDLRFGRLFRGKVTWKENFFCTSRLVMTSTRGRRVDPQLLLSIPDLLLPAMQVNARIRARNEAGWSNWSKPTSVRTKAFPSTPPQLVECVAVGRDFAVLAWMPPVSSNSPFGVIGYRIEMRVVRGEQEERRYEDVSTQELLREMHAMGYARRPSSSAHREGRKDEEQITAAPEQAAAAGEDDRKGWWAREGFSEANWFYAQVPRVVQQRASVQFPMVNEGNNLVVVQERVGKVWSWDKCILLPPFHCEPSQLAQRTEQALQDLVPAEKDERWSVYADVNGFLLLTFVRQFRLRMSLSLAYVYGFVLDETGWVVSSPPKTEGDKSTLRSSTRCKLETAVSDLTPQEVPLIHKLQGLPPDASILLVLYAKNGAGDEYGSSSSLGSPTPELLIRTDALLPPPPADVSAQGVLCTAVLVEWQRAATEPLYYEISFQLGEELEAQLVRVEAYREGHVIGNLKPAQLVRDIRVRSVDHVGVGPFSPHPCSARTLPALPCPPPSFSVERVDEGTAEFRWSYPADDGGSEVELWEIAGVFASGKELKMVLPASEAEAPLVHRLVCRRDDQLLDVRMRCRNKVGWSQRSTSSQMVTSSWDHNTRVRSVRMEERDARYRASLLLLRQAVSAALSAELEAERAARQPARVKKMMMEEAEVTVTRAETELTRALEGCEDCGVSMATAEEYRQELQDARAVMHRLRKKRGRRWGASRRGVEV